MVRAGLALLLFAAVSAAGGEDLDCPFCGQAMSVAPSEAWSRTYRCSDSACDATLEVFSDGTEKGIRVDRWGNRRIIVKDPRLAQAEAAAPEKPRRRSRGGRRGRGRLRVGGNPADSITLSHPVTRPGHAIGRPGHPVERPGHAVERPGHAIGRPGHAVERPGHAVTRPNHAIGRPGHAVERPGQAVTRPSHPVGLPGVAVVRPRRAPISRPGHPLGVGKFSGKPVDNTGPRFRGRRYSKPRLYSAPRRYSKRR